MSELKQKIQFVKARLKKEYLADSRPWVVTFSGGKDSTTVLHLVIDMLLELRSDGMQETKKLYVVSSDTGVEMPLIEDYAGNKLDQIKKFSAKEKLNVQVELLKPKVTDSFWTLLLGKGYPSPNQTFRWCTDRMKIRPATNFLKSLSDNNESILMLLGVRSDESISRAASIEKRNDNHRGFSMHPDIPNAFVYSPIKNWTNAEVWTFLSMNDGKAPWGKHNDMMVLYDKGSGEGDCNIALNPESQSCGKTRFGCWVCTVVSQDKSMANMLKNPEDQWMKPLHEFRNLLEEYRHNPEKRQPRRRNGQKSIGPFKLSTRKELLEKLLATEEDLKKQLEGKTLISDEELVQLQVEWLNDGDFFESAIKLARKYGRNIKYASVKAFNEDEQEYIDKICSEEENPINKELIDHIMQCEHSYRHHSIRAKAFGEFETIIERFAKGQLNEV